MTSRSHDIYASAPMRGLFAAEAVALAPALQRCVGACALQISASARDEPPASPMLDRWVRLHLGESGCIGDLHARADEPLPFLDDAFGLVLLRHALEVAPCARELLQEATRVLAPGGLLALTGMHPASAWMPWLLWRGRKALTLDSPLRVGQWLRSAALSIESVQRVGAAWPSAAMARHHGGPLGGGYLLVARKRREAALPIRLKPRALAATATPVGSLAPSARRHTAT